MKIVNDKEKNYFGEAYKLCFLVVGTHSKVGKTDSLFETIKNCILSLIITKCEPKKFLEFYEFTLKFASLRLCPQFFYNFQLVYTSLLKNECTEAETAFEITEIHLRNSEFELLGKVLRIVKFEAPDEPQLALNKLTQLCHSSPILFAVCKVISEVAFTRLQIFKTKPELWQDHAESHQGFYVFLDKIAEILAEKDISEAIRVLNTIGGLGRLAISNGSQSQNYKLEILKYLERYAELLHLLKNENKDKWQQCWYDLGVHLYSIGVHLNQNKCHIFLAYFRKFINLFLEFNTSIDKAYLVTCFNLISEFYYEEKNYENCLIYTALSIFYGDFGKSEISRWLLAKVGARDNNELQESTIVSILKNTEYNPEISQSRKIELLELELRAYNARWKSKISMITALKQLIQISSPEIVASLIVEIWGGGDLAVHEDFPKLLQDVIKKLEKGAVKGPLAHLYFLQHKYGIREALLQHCEEIERTMINTESRNRDDSEPDHECDLVSSYESLKLSRYLSLITNLDKSLDLCRNNPTQTEFRLLANLGHEFSLQGHTIKSLEAWKLAYSVAKTKREKVEAVGFLVEFSDPKTVYIKQLIEEAESYSEELKNEKCYYELIVFYLCKSIAYFYDNFETAYCAFKRVGSLQKLYQINPVLEAKIFLVEHKFLTLPCEFGVEGHEEFSLVRIHQASYKITAYFNETRSSSYDMRIFFEIYESLAQMYLDLSLPLQIRCYAKGAVVIAQKMLLPFRTISLLYYLAYADILSSKYDDARVKIRDFSEILGLKKSDKRIDDLCEEFALLEVPSATNPGSPPLQIERFKVPVFMEHDAKCECFYCMSFEYHRFALKCIFLEGLLNMFEEKTLVAKEFFKGCLTVFKFFKNNKSFEEKCSKRICKELVPSLEDHTVDVYCMALVKWGDAAIRYGRLSSAEKLNKVVLKCLENRILKNIYLYYEAVTQNLNILMYPTEDQQLIHDVEEIEDNGASAKTPETKESKVYLSPNLLPTNLDIVKLKPKIVKFEFSDSEDEAKTTPKPSTSKEVKPKKEVLREIDPVLASRTKLLTERLKSSSRKMKKECTNTKDVRQNLLQQLDDAENTEKCLRKTRSRSRK